MVRVQNITLQINEKEDVIKRKLSKKLGIFEKEIKDYRIIKKAIDARKKDQIKWVYTIDVTTDKEKWLIEKKRAVLSPSSEYVYVKTGEENLKHRPVVVGSGPCGMFAALMLAQMGYKPIVLERGADVDNRVKAVDRFWKHAELDVRSNVQFGEGGAGTFSDGKLTTQIKNNRCHKVLEELAKAGAPEDIVYKNKPHIGTDILRDVVKNIRYEIEKLGGEYRFETCVTDLIIENNKLIGVEVNGAETISTEICIMAIGHSARDTFDIIHKRNLNIMQKPFAMGMRIEHLQKWIDKDQYGDEQLNEVLGAADYKLVHHCQNGRTVYSFCMCPGGVVVASASEAESVVTNGMSEYKRDGENANSAILVNIKPEDFGSTHPLAGVELQRKFEKLAYDIGGKNYNAPCQRVEDFLNNKVTTNAGCVKPTYTPGVTWCNLRESLPVFMGDAIEEALLNFSKKIKHFNEPDALLVGFETRSSSPIRIDRTATYESNISGIYPAGEGAGYAGGITSAAVDGIEVAEAIARKYKPFN
ncbi:MAG: NAD(P)/FAD-dependent oxidoreductase [Cellulosilyticaceae bacterium]